LLLSGIFYFPRTGEAAVIEFVASFAGDAQLADVISLIVAFVSEA
jgi:hypothetical protein